jgi:hydrogenase nickel incorporation protein HypA/HybF
MHEFSIAQTILETVEENRDRLQKHNVDELELEIGKLSGIEIDALKFALKQLVNQENIFVKKINVHEIEPEGFCKTCNKAFKPEMYMSYCTLCGGFDVTIDKGRELIIKSITYS